ncbi:MAG TPA: short-chain dehydrogenase, partial [Burkholderiaceae bacterium]|nr:short-chain dehydrogenase [Burkholderiaceae bacterium]
MGPTLCTVFAEQGADVVESHADLCAVGAAEEAIRNAGSFDVLVANLSILAPSTPANDVGEE